MCKHANWEAPIDTGMMIVFDTRVMLCIAAWNMSVGPPCSELKPESRRHHLFELSSSSQGRIRSKWDQKYCGTAEAQKMFQFQHKWVWRLTSLGLSSFYSLCWGALWATTHEVCRRTALNQNTPFPGVVYAKVNLSSCSGLAVYFGVVDGLIAHVLSVQINNTNRSLLFNFICCNYR